MVKSAMTRDQFAAAQAVLAAHEGIALAGDRGQVSNRGVTATYNYDGEALQIVVTKTPWLVSKNYAEDAIASALREQGFPTEVVG